MGSVCFFNTAKAWGGGEKWHFEVSKHMHEKGEEVMVFAHLQSVLFQKLKEAKIPCEGIRVTNLSFLNPIKHLQLKKRFKKGQYQCVVMNLSRDVKVAGPSAKKAGINRIIYRRGSAIPIKNNFLNRYLFKNIVTEVLANSEATKRTINENNRHLFPSEKISVIYNGIDVTKSAKASSIKKSQTPVIVNLGRLEYQKNQKFLVELAKLLVQRGLDFKMIIGGEGRLKDDLQTQIHQLGLEKKVLLKGFIEHPLDFIHQADIFVLPSFWEGFGYVLAEAALCKKPIVAFNVSSNPEVVLDKKTGYLVPNGNTAMFADKISELLSNKDKRAQMGKAGHEFVKQNFDKVKQLQKIESFLLNG
ncbi:MAG: glycosyltransferase [Croceitalea sp.]|nr:glycosyltransferase [Croceitalea sp.]